MFRVYTTGGIAVRSDLFATIEDALKSCDERIAIKRPEQAVKLENVATGETYNEAEIAEIKKSLDA
jgi:hypothetical protein